jgi:hypothetical protein
VNGYVPHRDVEPHKLQGFRFDASHVVPDQALLAILLCRDSLRAEEAHENLLRAMMFLQGVRKLIQGFSAQKLDEIFGDLHRLKYDVKPLGQELGSVT